MWTSLSGRSLTDDIDNEADEDYDIGELPLEDAALDALPTNQTAELEEEPIQETMYENLHSQEAVNHLANEYLEMIRSEIARMTIRDLMAKLKQTLTKKASKKSFRRIEAEIAHFMNNPRTPTNVKKCLDDRLNYYQNVATPSFIRSKYEKINSFFNNKDVPKRLNYINESIVQFVKKPNVLREMADGIVKGDRYFYMEWPEWLLKYVYNA